MAQEEYLPIQMLVIWWQYEKHGTVRSLAKALGVTTATIYYWINGAKVPVKRLKSIEEVSDHVFTKEVMRPDLFQ